MLFQRSKYYKFDSTIHAQNAITRVQDMLFSQGFDKISNGSFQMRKIQILYNSFYPIVGLTLSDKSLIVRFGISRSTMFVFRGINICLFFFLVIVFALFLSGECKWYYCMIPLGMMIYSLALSKVLFDLSVRKIAAMLEELWDIAK